MERLGSVSVKRGALTGDYDNFWSFVLDAQRPAGHQHPNQREYHDYWLKETRSSWYGLEEDVNFEGVKALVRDGWPAGLRSMVKALGSLDIAVPLVSVRRRRVRSDFGDELDVHRLYSGDFERAFTSMKRPPGSKRRAFVILVDSIAYGGRRAQSMFWQGAAAIKLGEILSSAGYVVELRSGFKASCNSTKVSLSVVTKASDAPLDLCSAAATMALPAFFRCIGHAWIHANLHEKHDSSGVGVGSWESENGEIVADQSIDTPEEAIKWIERQIAALGLDRSEALEEKAQRGDDDDDDDGEDGYCEDDYD